MITFDLNFSSSVTFDENLSKRHQNIINQDFLSLKEKIDGMQYVLHNGSFCEKLQTF